MRITILFFLLIFTVSFAQGEDEFPGSTIWERSYGMKNDLNFNMDNEVAETYYYLGDNISCKVSIVYPTIYDVVSAKFSPYLYLEIMRFAEDVKKPFVERQVVKIYKNHLGTRVKKDYFRDGLSRRLASGAFKFDFVLTRGDYHLFEKYCKSFSESLSVRTLQLFFNFYDMDKVLDYKIASGHSLAVIDAP